VIWFRAITIFHARLLCHKSPGPRPLPVQSRSSLLIYPRHFPQRAWLPGPSAAAARRRADFLCSERSSLPPSPIQVLDSSGSFDPLSFFTSLDSDCTIAWRQFICLLGFGYVRVSMMATVRRWR
ncbi:hypothetical protein PVAP13_8NG105105, partial [Panicum virgatum]